MSPGPPSAVVLAQPGQLPRVADIAIDIKSAMVEVRTSAEPLSVALRTDSQRLHDMFVANWPASSRQAADYQIIALKHRPSHYRVAEHATGSVRILQPELRQLWTFGTESYTILKISTRAACSLVPRDDLVFVHGCTLSLETPSGDTGILIMGGSGAGKTTLVSSVRQLYRTSAVRVVNDDWGSVDLDSTLAVSTGESLLHMKQASIRAFCAGYFAQGDPLGQLNGTAGTRLLADPRKVFGVDGLADSVHVDRLVLIIRRPDLPIGVLPTAVTVELLESGEYSAYYGSTEPYFNGSLTLVQASAAEREARRYARLIKLTHGTVVNNSGSIDDLLGAFRELT